MRNTSAAKLHEVCVFGEDGFSADCSCGMKTVTATLVLAAQGHSLPPTELLLTDTHGTESLAMRGQWEPEMAFHH